MEKLRHELNETLKQVAGAVEVLTKMANIGIIFEEFDKFYYYRWWRDSKYYEWNCSKEVIATVCRDRERKIVGIKWNQNIYSPTGLLEKLIRKHREKIQGVAKLEDVVKEITKSKVEAETEAAIDDDDDDEITVSPFYEDAELYLKSKK